MLFTGCEKDKKPDDCMGYGLLELCIHGGFSGLSVVGLKGRCNEGVAELSEGDTPSVVLVYQAEAQLTLICFLDSLVNNSGHLRGDSIICCDPAKVREYGHDIGSSMLLITSSVSFSN